MDVPETGDVSFASGEFVAGIHAAWPILPGVIPLGIIYGATAQGAGLSAVLAAAMSVIVFSGSAQFVWRSAERPYGGRVGAPLSVVTSIG